MKQIGKDGNRVKLNKLIQELVQDGLKNKAAVISVEDVPSIRRKILAWLREHPDQVVPLAVEMIGFKAQQKIDDVETEDLIKRRERGLSRKRGR